jgi:oxygen-dependent protoporphyrinogen oxidase
LAGLNDNGLVKMVTDELRAIMGAEGKPVFIRVARWKQAIPQYTLGHLEIMTGVEQFESRHPGLFLSGNWRGGISVGDCVINSEKTFSRVQAFLANGRT